MFGVFWNQEVSVFQNEKYNILIVNLFKNNHRVDCHYGSSVVIKFIDLKLSKHIVKQCKNNLYNDQISNLSYNIYFCGQ